MSFSKIPAGKDLPNDIYVAIEIPANHAPIKYEIDMETDSLMVDRFMATPMFYPANYGFIPNTLADDGDELDVLVVTPYPVTPGAVIRASDWRTQHDRRSRWRCQIDRSTHQKSLNCTTMFTSTLTYHHCSLSKLSISLKTTKI